MRKFLKENLSQILNMIVTQVAITIFGFVLAMACSKSDPLLAVSSVLSVAFYLYLIFSRAYEIGQKDGIRIKAGRMDYRPMKGAWISLWANLINIILGILAVIGKACIENVDFFSKVAPVEGSATPLWAVNLYGVTSSIAEWIQCMYQGLARVFFSGNVLNLLLRPLPAILACAIAYPLGAKYSSGFLGRNKSGASDKPAKADKTDKTDRYR